MDMNEIMKQAQLMQERMQQLQAKSTTTTAT